MVKQDDSVSNFIPRNLLEIICKLESDEVRHSWKLIRNLDSSFSLVIKSPAQKCHASGQVPASRRDKKSQDSSNDKLTNQREKRSKRKRKSPSALARDRSRNKAFWKRVKASMKAQTQEARQEETRTEAIQLEKPDLLDSSPVVSEGVKDPTFSNLTVVQETAQKELNELSAEAAESGKQEILREFLDTSDIDSDDNVCVSVCALCKHQPKSGEDLLSCSRCRITKYCSLACQRKDEDFHRFACGLGS